MVALAIGLFLISGITATYSAIQVSIQTSKDLENAQEVIRYSSQVFTRSLKQTQSPPVLSAGDVFPMTVFQSANTSSCVGTTPTVAYYETFTFVAPTLSCSVSDQSDNSVIIADIPLLTGISSLTAVPDTYLYTFTVQPDFMPANFNGGINIDIALNSLIFKDNL